jgi:PhnB protein
VTGGARVRHDDGGAARLGVQAQLSVQDGRAAVEFYRSAFGATELFRHGGDETSHEVVAQLEVCGATFWVEDESPAHGNFSPATLGGATARMLLVVEDPRAVLARAVDSGAEAISPVTEEHGWLLGRVVDPFGHHWEIGKPLGAWPPGRSGAALHGTGGD